MKDVTLNQKEQARISVLNSVLEYQVPIVQAAEVLGVSSRHARRLLAAYRQDGAVPRQLYLPVGVNQFCRFTSLAWPRCWAALVR